LDAGQCDASRRSFGRWGEYLIHHVVCHGEKSDSVAAARIASPMKGLGIIGSHSCLGHRAEPVQAAEKDGESRCGTHPTHRRAGVAHPMPYKERSLLVYHAWRGRDLDYSCQGRKHGVL
jgi:hypothetical protein